MPADPAQPAPAPEASAPGRHVHMLSWAVAVGLAALVIMFVASDGRKLLETAATLALRLLVLPLTCGVASYAVMARSYQGIATAAELDAIVEEVRQEIDAAVEFAKASPEPDPATNMDYIYA